MLRATCAANARLEFISLSDNSVLPHGEALNLLFRKTEGERWFGIVDSDVLATNSFLNDCAYALRDAVGIFSATALWCDANDSIWMRGYRMMLGTHHSHTEDGITLGTTSFAIYRRNDLALLFDQVPTGFRQLHFRKLEKRVQEIIETAGYRAEFYDTAKILNVLLIAQGLKLAFEPLPQLLHVGGMTESKSGVVKLRIAGILPLWLRTILMWLIWKRAYGVGWHEALATVKMYYHRRAAVLKVSALIDGWQPEINPNERFPDALVGKLTDLRRELPPAVVVET